ncbi:hypothetical protein ACLOJK_005155 [Asimina triloba]
MWTTNTSSSSFSSSIFSRLKQSSSINASRYDDLKSSNQKRTILPLRSSNQNVRETLELRADQGRKLKLLLMGASVSLPDRSGRMLPVLIFLLLMGVIKGLPDFRSEICGDVAVDKEGESGTACCPDVASGYRTLIEDGVGRRCRH